MSRKRIELLRVSKMNGEKKEIDYNYRKSGFDSFEEMEKYRSYLESKLDLKLFFDFRDYSDKPLTPLNS